MNPSAAAADPLHVRHERAAPAAAPVLWGLVDDRVGHTGQVLGVLARLNTPYLIKRLEFTRWAALPASVLGPSLRGVDRATRAALAPPYPALVIAAGRRMLPVLRYIKRQSPSTRTVYLMKPELDRDLDLVVVPAHDAVPNAPHHHTTLAPLHATTPELLALAAREWEARFAHLPHPRVVLSIGGSTQQGSYRPEHWHELLRRAILLAGARGSLLITTSRRTPAQALPILSAIPDGVPHSFYRWEAHSENPYHAMLGLADAVIVTGDSLSMCTEACVTGKPVFIYAVPEVAPAKHRALHQTLYSHGLARPLDDHACLGWRPDDPLNDLEPVAHTIRHRFAELFHHA